ncbi:patatin-like phospholipase-like protein [Tomelloso virus]|uniref:Patatin-like phospholipase-like protein n=1 Tax=Tomelloso virus TaxID=2053981 RepID=A0A2H4T2U1_9VIRU|nr:patatin-like phospholipase-like protein [Tomelloso virus]ATY70200.1 patatin-like phospholipase-like protein [Tomelloso virus]
MRLSNIVLLLFIGKVWAESANEPLPPFKNIAFEGGGSKALSYVGSLLALKEFNYYTSEGKYTFDKIGGTSAGCFVGFLVALDIDPEKIEELIYKLDIFQSSINFDGSILDFNNGQNPHSEYNQDEHLNENGIPIAEEGLDDTSWYTIIMKTFGIINRAKEIVDLWLKHNSPGLSNEKMFIDFMNKVILPLSRYRSQIKSIETLNFIDLEAKTNHNLHCFATQLNDRLLYEFSSKQTPHEYVAKALYASMSLPGLFKPLVDGCGKTLVDGGLLYNFPINMNDADGVVDDTTLGLSLGKKPTEYQHTEINDLAIISNQNFKFSKMSTIDYFEAIYSIMIDQEALVYSSKSFNEHRVIYLESPIKTLDLNLKHSIKSLAINKAYLNTVKFLKEKHNM